MMGSVGGKDTFIPWRFVCLLICLVQLSGVGIGGSWGSWLFLFFILLVTLTFDELVLFVCIYFAVCLFVLRSSLRFLHLIVFFSG